MVAFARVFDMTTSQAAGFGNIHGQLSLVENLVVKAEVTEASAITDPVADFIFHRLMILDLEEQFLGKVDLVTISVITDIECSNLHSLSP